MPPPSSNKKKSKKDKKDRKHRKEGGGGHRGSGIDALVESGNEHIALDRVEEGLADLRKAHQLAPDSADAAEAYGMALAEYGDGATAVMILKRAAMLRPNEGYEKFMYLGQLIEDGVAAATCTRQARPISRWSPYDRVGTGLNVIEFQAAHGDEDASERMGGACCALAEQLMATTDDVREVADECDALLRRAAECDPRSAEPLQVMASLRAAQGRTEEALEALRQSIAQWRGARDAQDEEDNEFLGEYDVSFEFRFETAKLLLELDTSTDEAIDVLEELLEERDDVVDVWHLLALANHGCCAFDKALEHLDHAEELLRRRGGDEMAEADMAELRAAIVDSKGKWNEEGLGEDGGEEEEEEEEDDDDESD